MLLTTAQAAEILKCSPDAVRAMVERAELIDHAPAPPNGWAQNAKHHFRLDYEAVMSLAARREAARVEKAKAQPATALLAIRLEATQDDLEHLTRRVAALEMLLAAVAPDKAADSIDRAGE